ncbi:unnamed protein product, partial [Meganyctiphanes norvegica]
MRSIVASWLPGHRLIAAILLTSLLLQEIQGSAANNKKSPGDEKSVSQDSEKNPSATVSTGKTIALSAIEEEDSEDADSLLHLLRSTDLDSGSIGEDKRNVASLAAANDYPKWQHKREADSDIIGEDKRNVASLASANDYPKWQHKRDTVSDSISEDKRNVAALAAANDYPKWQHKRNTDSEGFAEDKRNVASLAASNAYPNWQHKRDTDSNNVPYDSVDNDEEKRSLASLVRNGDIKRNIASLARNNELKSLMSKKNNFTNNNDDSIFVDDKRSYAALAKANAFPDSLGNKRSLASLVKNNDLPFSNNKRSFASLARSGNMPFYQTKKSFAALAKSGSIPANLYDKRSYAALARSSNLPYADKRSYVSLARSGNLPIESEESDIDKRAWGRFEGNMVPEAFGADEDKRSYASLARSGSMPFNDKRSLASLVSSGNMPYETNKRGIKLRFNSPENEVTPPPNSRFFNGGFRGFNKNTDYDYDTYDDKYIEKKFVPALAQSKQNTLDGTLGKDKKYMPALAQSRQNSITGRSLGIDKKYMPALAQSRHNSLTDRDIIIDKKYVPALAQSRQNSVDGTLSNSDKRSLASLVSSGNMPDIDEKRSFASLVKNNNLPFGSTQKRSYASLAQNNDPFFKEKEKRWRWARFGSIPVRYERGWSQFNGGDMNEFPNAEQHSEDKRSYTALTRNGDFPFGNDKRSLASLASSGNMPDETDKRSLASLASSGNMPDETVKRSLASLVSSGNMPYETDKRGSIKLRFNEPEVEVTPPPNSRFFSGDSRHFNKAREYYDMPYDSDKRSLASLANSGNMPDVTEKRGSIKLRFNEPEVEVTPPPNSRFFSGDSRHFNKAREYYDIPYESDKRSLASLANSGNMPDVTEKRGSIKLRFNEPEDEVTPPPNSRFFSGDSRHFNKAREYYDMPYDSDKRSLASLANSGNMPDVTEKRGSIKLRFNEPEVEVTPPPNSRFFSGDSRHFNKAREFYDMPYESDKRSLASLANSGNMPDVTEKRGSIKLRFNEPEVQVTPPPNSRFFSGDSRHFNKAREYYDMPYETDKRSLASLASSDNMPDETDKRSLASLVSAGNMPYETDKRGSIKLRFNEPEIQVTPPPNSRFFSGDSRHFNKPREYYDYYDYDDYDKRSMGSLQEDKRSFASLARSGNLRHLPYNADKRVIKLRFNSPKNEVTPPPNSRFFSGGSRHFNTNRELFDIFDDKRSSPTEDKRGIKLRFNSPEIEVTPPPNSRFFSGGSRHFNQNRELFDIFDEKRASPSEFSGDQQNIGDNLNSSGFEKPNEHSRKKRNTQISSENNDQSMSSNTKNYNRNKRYIGSLAKNRDFPFMPMSLRRGYFLGSLGSMGSDSLSREKRYIGALVKNNNMPFLELPSEQTRNKRYVGALAKNNDYPFHFMTSRQNREAPISKDNYMEYLEDLIMQEIHKGILKNKQRQQEEDITNEIAQETPFFASEDLEDKRNIQSLARTGYPPVKRFAFDDDRDDDDLPGEALGLDASVLPRGRITKRFMGK